MMKDILRTNTLHAWRRMKVYRVAVVAIFIALFAQNVVAYRGQQYDTSGAYRSVIDALKSSANYTGELPLAGLYYPTTLDRSSKLSEGSKVFYELEASLCTTALIDNINGKLDDSVGLYEQLYMMIELWDVGVQKGDALLSMRQQSRPELTYNEESGNWTVSPDTHVGFSSHNLFLPYHKLTVPVDMLSVVDCVRSKTAEKCSKILWYVSLYNVEFWTKQGMTFHIKATCTYPSGMPCERTFGPDSKECNGKGLCVKPGASVQYNRNGAMTEVLDPANAKTVFRNIYNQTLCQCSAYYGNTGCQTTVFELEENKWRYEAGLATDQWRYYRYIAKQSSLKAMHLRKYLRIELNWSQGDTILFAKNILDGSIVNGLPHLMDYQMRSDKESFRNRQDYHYIILDNIDMKYQNPIYFIAVLNNNAQVKMDAKYHIRVQEIVMPSVSSTGVCGNDCGGVKSGECVRRPDGDKCVCNEDYAGPLCEGHLEKLIPQQFYSGILSAGEIHYYKMEIASDKNMKHYSMSDGFLGPIKWDLIIEFNKDGGQIVVMGNYDETPSIHDNDFVYTFGVQDDNNSTTQNTMLTRPEMDNGIYYIAVFNHNYQKVETPCSYNLRVSLVSDIDLIYGPYIPVVLGVLVAMFLLLLTAVCWKFALRHTSIGRILFNTNSPNTRSFTFTDGLGNPTNRNPNSSRDNRRGLSKESINQLPEIKYCLPAGEHQGDEPLCSICLSEFEKDDVLKRIPACNHEFHKACIEQWLFNHTNCPMCRVEINSNPMAPQPPLPHSPSPTRSSPELEEDEEVQVQDLEEGAVFREVELQPVASTSSSGSSSSTQRPLEPTLSIEPPTRERVD